MKVSVQATARTLLALITVAATACEHGGSGADADAEGVLPITPSMPVPDAEAQADAAEDRRYIVRWDDPVAGRRAVEQAGGVVVRELPEFSAAAVIIPQGAMDAMGAAPGVVVMERDARRYPLAQATPYGIALVQADQLAQDTNDDVSVCIIDSGYALGHPDLPQNGVTGDDDPGTGSVFQDACGHGTHVAGTIAALDNDRGVVGVFGAGGLHLHIVKIFGDDCSWAYSSDLAAAVNACVAAAGGRPMVINMSLGGTSSNALEELALTNAYNAGRVLPVAAAGNKGTYEMDYPASYPAVVSVAAVDEDRTVADFSQHNAQVELAAPGVAVRSTMLHTASVYAPDASLSVGGQGYDSLAMEDAANGTGSGPLWSCGTAESTCVGAGGRVCLIERGNNTFADKVLNCQAGGGVAAVIFNNLDGVLEGTLNNVATSIPTVAVTKAAGAILLGHLGEAASVSLDGSADYTTIGGTSMATPHVAGVAALIWSHFPGISAQTLRGALTGTALDLGPAGRDESYGYGLVQGAAAFALLAPACLVDDDCPDDDNACNGVARCQGGECVVSAQVQCDDGKACTADSCNPQTGACVHASRQGAACGGDVGACQAGSCQAGNCVVTVLPDGTACADQNACNGDETCQGGACIGGDDLAAGTPCGDLLFCTGQERCDGAGTCVATQPPCGANETCVETAKFCFVCTDNNIPCSLNAECCSGFCHPTGVCAP